MKTRPIRTMDKTTGVLDEWCVWHAHWVLAVHCPHCGLTYPACYALAHLRFACAFYEETR